MWSIIAESHAAVRRMFGKHLVLSGDVERRWANYIGESLDDRLAADYDIGTFHTLEEARQECERAADFVARIREFLLHRGLTELELATK